ncbi:MAG: DUF255 domain-containing protein [Planctomycetaceae bacterium]|nr:DUF255 domain-containing protein [Planctomycetaceae bacterium]
MPSILLSRRFFVFLAALFIAITPFVESAVVVQAQAPEGAEARKANRLAKESSPYLLLHAHNPVDWFPWEPEALARAKAENKPIFLSIGYSSCFWCHVMEREVFENEEIAAYMNEHFINIKVDREERPDLDDIYMLSLQVYFQLAGSQQGGGWPLSMFLTPDGLPIAGGTYFPPEDRNGRPGFLNVAKQVSGAWDNQNEAVVRTAEIVAKEVRRLSRPAATEESVALKPELVRGAIDEIASSFDPEFGGFDFSRDNPDGPKFPVPSRLMLMQAQIDGTPRSASFEQMVDKTLAEIAAGGIRDHLGGGFHRYSTDRMWIVPHFEKMLYDNAQLAEVFLDAYRRTNRDTYRQVVVDTLDFVLREMTGPQGGFYSALDAETNGIEGKYYVWTADELESVLKPDDLRVFTKVYGAEGESAFELGYVLHLPRPLEKTADQLELPLADLKLRLKTCREQLLAAREKRPALLQDDKILTSWNGLMIRALARAGKVLSNRDYLAAAEKATIYLLSRHRDQEGRLLRSSRNGQAKLPAYLDDYAFFVSGLLALHEATGDEKWLAVARRLTDDQIALFNDGERGGFNFTSMDHEALLARTKNAYDSVLPSGNSISVRNLITLSRATGSDKYGQVALKNLQAFAPQLRKTPANLSHMALALQEFLHYQGDGQLANTTQGDLFSGGISSPKPDNKPAMTKPPIKPPQQSPTVVTFSSKEAALGEEHQITASGFLSVNKAKPGQAVPVAVVIAIEEGWHINANPPKPDFVIPTSLSLVGETPVTLESVQYPEGHPFQIEGFDEAVNVYEGEIVLRGQLHIPKGVQGALPLSLQVRYQACNNENCLRPMKLQLSGEVPIAQDGDTIQAVNAALFPANDSQ